MTHVVKTHILASSYTRVHKGWYALYESAIFRAELTRSGTRFRHSCDLGVNFVHFSFIFRVKSISDLDRIYEQIVRGIYVCKIKNCNDTTTNVWK